MTITFPKQVRLSWYELAIAVNVGVRRRISCLMGKMEHKHGLEEGNDWQLNIVGAIAEMVLAKCLGVYWSGSVDTFKRHGDVGPFEVRSTPLHANRLIIRKSDSSDAIYWLVTGVEPDYIVQGWISGAEGKKDEFLDDAGKKRPEAYFVPNHALHNTYSLEP